MEIKNLASLSMLGEGQKKFVLVKIASFFLSLLFCLAIVAPNIASAQTLNTGIDYVAYTGLADADIRVIIARIIRVFLGVLGIVVLGFVIYGGYMYMTAGGNEEQVATAKKILKNTIIGLAIILMSFSIVQFVINSLLGQYQGAGTGQEGASGAGSDDFRSSGLLGSVIESHYPARNATEIPRNTKIVITFRQPILENTAISNGQIVSENIKIYPTPTPPVPPNPPTAPVALGANDVFANITADKKTLVLRTRNYLGDGRNDVKYTVYLSGIKLANGQNAFPAIANHYAWEFTVSVELDITPPFVESVFPLPATTAYARNILVQINFNEPVDPISASGFFQSGDPLKNFQKLNLRSAAGLVSGEFRLTNQYRTVEFRSSDECGKNPCGQSVYCLPSNAVVTTTVRAASIDPGNAPQALITADIYDGVVDMAGNSLDGGGELRLESDELKVVPGNNGAASGPPTDNFVWKFSTSAALDTTAPKLLLIKPAVNQENVSSDALLELTFDKLMSISSFSNISLKTNKDTNVWYTVKAVNYDNNVPPQEVTAPSQVPVRTTAEILHGDFIKEPIGVQSAIYYPFAPSTINDVFQNCFYPAVDGAGECGAADFARDAKPSCYNGRALPGVSTCGVGETCPYSVPPKP